MIGKNNFLLISRKYYMSFDQLGLRPELLRAVKARGYLSPNPIQIKAIPAILAGRDVFACALTGTGKTDAFVLPLVELLSREKSNRQYIRVLILTPTRELANQVGEIAKAYTRVVSMRCTVVYGGVRIKPQADRIKRGIDILVATPGRLLDLVEQKYLNLSHIEFLVFDEADRMLDLGFSNEVSRILDHVPIKPKTMLFSATYTRQIRNLAESMLQNPEYIEVAPGNTAADSVAQKIHMVDRTNKRALLVHLIDRNHWKQLLVFIRTKRGADKLVLKLAAKGLSVSALHGNKSQSVRRRTLEEFKKGKINILVATDVAARGLDIINLPCVVNYDMPDDPVDYIHRIGRTGRAGVNGLAVSFVSKDEKLYLKAIERLLKKKICVEKVDCYTEDSDVPDFVLLRPDNLSSEKKADKDIKELVKKRKSSKQPPKSRNVKSTGSSKSFVDKSKSGRKTVPEKKTRSRSESHSRKITRQSKPRKKR